MNKIIAVIAPFTCTQTFQVFDEEGKIIDTIELSISDLHGATIEILALADKYNIQTIHLLGAQCYTCNLGNSILNMAKTLGNYSALTIQYS